jgi:rod shape-determining protein MreD
MSARHINPGLALGLLIVIVAALIQEGVISYVNVDSVRPDIVLLLVVGWSLLRGVEEGMLWGLVGGFVVDALTGLPMGTSSTAYVVVAGLAMFAAGAMSRAHLVLPLVAGFVATFVFYAVAFVIISSEEHQFFLSQGFLSTVIKVALFNAVVCPLVIGLCYALDRRLRPVARTLV